VLNVGSYVAHAGAPLRPHDAWAAWQFDPFVIASLVAVGVLHWRGWRPADGTDRALAWWAGWVALVIALVSPVDAVAGVLVSAHMVQHVLLVAVAAPLLAASAPGAALLRGAPRPLRRFAVSVPSRLGVGIEGLRLLRGAAARWLIFVGAFWLWHASVLYGAAVDSSWIHALEHASFLVTALALWSVLLGPRRVRVDRGQAVVMVFLLGLQSVLLATLITFASTPWYEPYSSPAPGWGLEPLADQQLAGVVMWVPSGLILTGVGILLLVRWLREIDDEGSRRDRTGTLPM
jgi:cytochrome c oxidase assembly factor CtaG